MPPPGDTGAGAHREAYRATRLGRALRAGRRRRLAPVASVLNALQFLTIRRYLSFVFAALVILLLALALWQ